MGLRLHSLIINESESIEKPILFVVMAADGSLPSSMSNTEKR